MQEEPLPPLALVSFTEEEQVGILVLLHQISNLVRSGKTRTNFTVEPAWMSCQPPAIYSIDCQLEEITVLLPVRLPNIEQVEREKLRACCSPPPLCSPPLFVFAEKFFHVCKQRSCTSADRTRRWSNSRGTKRPKYLKR